MAALFFPLSFFVCTVKLCAGLLAALVCLTNPSLPVAAESVRKTYKRRSNIRRGALKTQLASLMLLLLSQTVNFLQVKFQERAREGERLARSLESQKAIEKRRGFCCCFASDFVVVQFSVGGDGEYCVL